jgi:hypothetical protein
VSNALSGKYFDPATRFAIEMVGARRMGKKRTRAADAPGKKSNKRATQANGICPG